MLRTQTRARASRRSGRTRGVRGVGFVWFCLMALPVLFFSIGLSVDLTKIIVGHREATNLAGASAIAGAFEFQEGQAYLDPYRAEQVAKETWEIGDEGGAVRLLKPGASVTTVTFDDGSDPTEITVEVEYTIDGLVFAPIFTDTDAVEGVVRRTASVCVPGAYDPTDGYCARPAD